MVWDPFPDRQQKKFDLCWLGQANACQSPLGGVFEVVVEVFVVVDVDVEPPWEAAASAFLAVVFSLPAFATTACNVKRELRRKAAFGWRHSRLH